MKRPRVRTREEVCMNRKFFGAAAIVLSLGMILFLGAMAQDTASPEATSPEATSPEAASQGAAPPEATTPEAASPEAAPPEAGAQQAAPSEAAPQEAAKPKKVEKAVCLACHGPFDDLAAATSDYKAPSGETISPHRYVPHDQDQEIPECTLCHTPHPIPPDPNYKPKNPPKVDWCYATCHHMNDFQPCSSCH